jgi:hypothetical protein
VDAIGGGLDFAGAQQLVDQGLGCIAGGCGELGFIGVGGDGIRVVGEQVPQVEGEGRGLVDGDGAAGGELAGCNMFAQWEWTGTCARTGGW